MKIDNKLSRLIDALGSSSSRTPQSTEIKQLSADELNADTVGAVRVASDFGVAGGNNGGESRADKLARIKAQVDANDYKPDNVRVAEAFARDLL